MLQTVRRTPLAKHIKAVSVIAFVGLLALAQLPSKAQEKKNQTSPEEQSIKRDQAYVQQLLERGASDAKVESLLKLTSQFASFNRGGDFHGYALGLIAKERAVLKQRKPAQQVAAQTASTGTVAENSSVGVSGSVTAPSNPVGVGSVKVIQENSRETAQDTSATKTPDNTAVAVSSPSPAFVGGGVILPTTSAPSNGGVSARSTSISTSSSSPVAAATGGSSGGTSLEESWGSGTFNSAQGPGPGPIGPGPGCNLFPAPP